MTQNSVTLRIPATLDSLAGAQDFLRERSTALGVPEELWGRLELILEELVVNIGSYAYPDGEGDMEVGCEVLQKEPGTSAMLCIILRDWGVPFDPLGKESPDVDADIEARPVGGLGIYLIRELTDHCAYQRNGDANEFRAYLSMEVNQ
jgi:anti-sigma regulatory factor (Ser/Thr protein kinase)